MVNGYHTARADVLTVFEGKDLKVLCSKVFSFRCCIKWVNTLNLHEAFISKTLYTHFE